MTLRLTDEEHEALRERASRSIVGNHSLVDGNKRLGWLAAAVFLEVNGVGITAAPNDDVYRLVMRVASESPDVEEIATWLRALA